ncbi:MAG: hypothetical protein AABP62_01515 [Planctomycetota bacterium]
MRNLMGRFFPLAMVSLIVLTIGCGGSGLKLKEVSGKATFAGKPIVYGLIEFIPNKAKNHSAPAGSAEIVGGQYDTRKMGRGVVAGPHLVRITGYEERPAPGSADETVITASKPPLFAGFTIEAEVPSGAQQDFDVPESALGFDLLKP